MSEATVETMSNPVLPQARRTRARWLMLGLVFAGTISIIWIGPNMSVVAPLISKEFEVTPVAMGILFSAFSWAFAVTTLPGVICSTASAPS